PLNEIDEKRLQQHLLEHLEQLQKEGRRQLLEEGVTAQAITLQPSLDLRYRGQSYTLNIPFTDISQARADFHKAHELRYGHRLDMPVDLINLRLRVVADAATVVLPERPAATTPIDPVSTAELYGVGTTVIYQREQLPAGCQIRGPALICEQIATTLIETNWTAEVDRQGNLRLRFETSD
ncbi:MAG: hydantoinase/oxoprolinase family protein, partial [Exilibacterium sp.]